MRCFKIAIGILKHPAKRDGGFAACAIRSYSPRKPKACIAAVGGIANNCIVCNIGQYIMFGFPAFPKACPTVCSSIPVRKEAAYGL